MADPEKVLAGDQGAVDMEAVQADAARRQANPGPIDTSPSAFARNPGPPDPLTEGVRAVGTGKDPGRAMTAVLNAPTQGAGPDTQPNGVPTAAVQPEDRQPLKWDQVVKTQGYLNLDLEGRESARQQYFNQVVAPQVATDDLPEARRQFNAATTGKAGYALLPNNDDTQIENRASASKDLQKFGVRADIADRIAMTLMPPLDSRTKAMMDQGVANSVDADKLLGLATTGPAGAGAVAYLKQLFKNKQAASAAAAKAAEDLKFATTPSEEILAKDAAATPPKFDPSNPFNAAGGTKAGLRGVAGEEQFAQELSKSPALQKAYNFVKAHPAFSTAAETAAATGIATGGFGVFPQANLIYHIARSLKGIAKLLPEVTGD